MNGGHFDRDGLLIVGGHFQGLDQLGQVFYRIDVMVRSRGNGVRPGRDHAGFSHIRGNLLRRQVSANTRFSPLTDFNFYCGGIV